MSETIKEFLVGLGFKVDESSMKNFTSGVKRATVVATAMGAAILAVNKKIVDFISGVAQELDTISDLSIRVNGSAHEIMRMGYVASLTDSSVEAVNRSFDQLNRYAGEASIGLGRARMVFEEIGVSVTDSNGKLKNTTDLMTEIGASIKDFEKGKQLGILNRLGIDPTMIYVLTNDVRELNSEFDEIYETAGIKSAEAVQAGSDFEDSLGRLRFTMDAIRKSVALQFMGQVKTGIDSMRKWLVSNMPRIINTIKPIVATVLSISDVFFIVAQRIGGILVHIIDAFNDLNDKTDGWAAYILAAITAWKMLNLAFLATPLGILASLVAAIALLVDDFMVFKEGGDSFFNWGPWMEEINLLIDVLKWLKSIVDEVFMFIFATVDAVISLFKGDFRRAMWAAGESVKQVQTFFQPFLDTIASIGNKIASLPGIKTAMNYWLGQSAPTGGNQNVNQKTEIIVQGATRPEETARSVMGLQNRVNQDMTRNLLGAVR